MLVDIYKFSNYSSVLLSMAGRSDHHNDPGYALMDAPSWLLAGSTAKVLGNNMAATLFPREALKK